MSPHEQTAKAADKVARTVRRQDAVRMVRDAGVSKAEAARRVGVDRSTVSRWTKAGQ